MCEILCNKWIVIPRRRHFWRHGRNGDGHKSSRRGCSRYDQSYISIDPASEKLEVECKSRLTVWLCQITLGIGNVISGMRETISRESSHSMRCFYAVTDKVES